MKNEDKACDGVLLFNETKKSEPYKYYENKACEPLTLNDFNKAIKAMLKRKSRKPRY